MKIYCYSQNINLIIFLFFINLIDISERKIKKIIIIISLGIYVFYVLTVFIILKYFKFSIFIWRFCKIYNFGLMVDIRFYFDPIKFENLELYFYFSDYKNLIIGKIS